MSKTNLMIVLIVVVLAAAGLFIIRPKKAVAPQEGGNTATTTQTTKISIEDYVRQNINSLSPEGPVLGGKFYVTSIEAHGGAGTVNYEDGHIALVADFTYSVDESGNPSVKTFTIRK